ncbi:MAG: hypothetical protein ABIK09_14615 [Pseudomonadota bacterium]
MGNARSSLVLVVVLTVVGACGSGGNPLPPTDVATEIETVCVGCADAAPVDLSDAVEGPFCTVAWSWKSISASGATAHLAREEGGLLYVSAYGGLYALGKSGKEEWVWPDDDAETSPISPVDAQLGTPSVGEVGRIYVGTAGEGGWEDDPARKPPQVLCLNQGGTGRWAFDVTAPVRAAPTVLLRQPGVNQVDVLVLTEDGTLYKLHDNKQNSVFRRWSIPDDPGPGAHAFAPLPGAQVLADEREGVEPVAWILGVDSVSLVRWWKEGEGTAEIEVAEVAWTVPLPEDTEATSNPVLDADGVFHFGAGTDHQGEGNYATVRILSLDRDGTWVGGADGVSPALNSTAITGLTEGLGGTWLVGTSNNGVAILFAATGELLARHFDNFLDVPAPVQTADKLVVSSSIPHWVHVMGLDGEVRWRLNLQDSIEGVVDFKLAPSSPLVGPDGTVYVHAGNAVVALSCTGAPPASVTWRRHGGNDKNTGNLVHSLP